MRVQFLTSQEFISPVMLLRPFHQDDNGTITIAAEQASRFAKEIAKDFNPIHDVDAKRFCVPGDLLFSLVLKKYGLSQRMAFNFAGMVGHGVNLQFADEVGEDFEITDDKDKTYLKVKREGKVSRCDAQIEALIKDYVAFSGQNFPYILVPLMAKHQVMINPARPLVMYESMEFDLHDMDFCEPELVLVKSELDVEGKRGDARLTFEIRAEGKVIGTGVKKLIMSGLRPYETDAVEHMCNQIESWKADYAA